MLRARIGGAARSFFADTLSRYLPESAYIRLLTNSVSWRFHFFFCTSSPSRRCTWRWGSTLLVPGEPADDRIFEFIVSCRFMVSLWLHCLPPSLSPRPPVARPRFVILPVHRYICISSQDSIGTFENFVGKRRIFRILKFSIRRCWNFVTFNSTKFTKRIM